MSNETKIAAGDIIEAVEAYLEAQGALDNRELMGPNAPPYEVLRGVCNKAYEQLEDALHAAKIAAAAPAATPAFDVEQMLRDCVPGGNVCDPQQVADSLREWFAATHAAAEEPAKWRPIETAPRDGRKLMLHYQNRYNNARTVLARWLTDEQAEETDDDGVGLEGGWYECIDNWDDYAQVAVHEGEPTHWMPLPPPPDTMLTGLTEAETSETASVAGNDAKQAELNDWFLSLPEGRRATLIADKWMLAAAAFDAGKSSSAAAVQAEPAAYWIPATEQFSIATPGERPFAKAWQPLYAHPAAAQPQATEATTSNAQADGVWMIRSRKFPNRGWSVGKEGWGDEDHECALFVPCSMTAHAQATEREALSADARDAKRYRWLRHLTRGEVNHTGRKQQFAVPIPMPVGNIMKGSVAQHLDEAIDAAMTAAKATGSE